MAARFKTGIPWGHLLREQVPTHCSMVSRFSKVRRSMPMLPATGLSGAGVVAHYKKQSDYTRIKSNHLRPCACYSGRQVNGREAMS